MNDARHIGEEFAWASSQRLISALRCRLANEFRNRFALYGGGTLNLFVELRVQAEASHAEGVSHMIRDVIRRFGGTFERIGHAKRTGAVRRPVSMSMFRRSPAVPVCCYRRRYP